MKKLRPAEASEKTDEGRREATKKRGIDRPHIVPALLVLREGGYGRRGQAQ